MEFHRAMEMGRSKVQKLYDACDVVFSCGREGLPTLRQIRWLQELLDAMEPVDVGIDGSGSGDGSGDDGMYVTSDGSGDESSNSDVADVSPRSRSGLMAGHAVKHITYVHIHECEDFSMGIFCFPAGTRLPLHDHPGMVVLSKVLYGSVSLKAYDWVTLPNSKPRKNGLAKMVADDRILDASSKASVLFPRSGGNIHAFTALTPCAILDVLAPPYSDELGRPSTYYSPILVPSLPGFVVLEETVLPEDLVVVGAPYVGPELVLDSDSY